MSGKIPEIVILSYCKKEGEEENDNVDTKNLAGFKVYEKFTGDKNFEPPRNIHPTFERDINKNKYKIHFFYIIDSYWPAISNICRNCDGAVFVIDMDNYTEDSGIEFIKEWLINLDDLDKNEMKIVIICVSAKNEENERQKKGKEDIEKLAAEKKIPQFWANIEKEEGKKVLNEAFTKVANLINNENDYGNTNNNDDDIEEYLDKYKNF